MPATSDSKAAKKTQGLAISLEYSISKHAAKHRAFAKKASKQTFIAGRNPQ
jgi:hypothetical protein